jgi:hypothetical protein
MLLTLGCASHGRPGAIDPTGKDFAALLDSDQARLLLADLLARGSADPRLAALAPPVVSADLVPDRPGPMLDPGWLPDQAWLRERALEVSTDFAALAFAHAVGADERSRAVQAVFDRSLHDGAARSEEVLRQPGAFPYTVLFAPSWLYRSHPANGADFARQRRLLDRLGIASRLIATAESGSVEDNAAAIAAAVREAGQRREAVILVSASKSGAEVALALSGLLTPAEAASVAGWLNVAGALHGTPLADAALRPPASWIARFAFWVTGWNWAGLTSMATGPSRRRLEGARLPDSIAVINLVAVPVSGSVGAKVVLGYKILRSHGPNDGVVLLTATVWPGGANIVALGADHLFAAGQEDAHGMALLRATEFAVRLHGARSDLRPRAERSGTPAEGDSGGDLGPPWLQELAPIRK